MPRNARSRSSLKARRSSKWLSPGSCTPVRIASTIRSRVARAMRSLATPCPASMLPSALAADSIARTTVVPMATMRPPFDFVCLIAAISGRGDTSGVRKRGEADAALSPRCKRAPVKCKSGRRWLERNRVGCNPRPDVGQGQKFGYVCVLDRPSVSRKAFQDKCRIV